MGGVSSEGRRFFVRVLTFIGVEEVLWAWPQGFDLVAEPGCFFEVVGFDGVL